MTDTPDFVPHDHSDNEQDVAPHGENPELEDQEDDDGSVDEPTP
jgi:hypothetical protein